MSDFSFKLDFVIFNFWFKEGHIEKIIFPWFTYLYKCYITKTSYAFEYLLGLQLPDDCLDVLCQLLLVVLLLLLLLLQLTHPERIMLEVSAPLPTVELRIKLLILLPISRSSVKGLSGQSVYPGHQFLKEFVFSGEFGLYLGDIY